MAEGEAETRPRRTKVKEDKRSQDGAEGTGWRSGAPLLASPSVTKLFRFVTSSKLLSTLRKCLPSVRCRYQQEKAVAGSCTEGG